DDGRGLRDTEQVRDERGDEDEGPAQQGTDRRGVPEPRVVRRPGRTVCLDEVGREPEVREELDQWEQREADGHQPEVLGGEQPGEERDGDEPEDAQQPLLGQRPGDAGRGLPGHAAGRSVDRPRYASLVRAHDVPPFVRVRCSPPTRHRLPPAPVTLTQAPPTTTTSRTVAVGGVPGPPSPGWLPPTKI